MGWKGGINPPNAGGTALRQKENPSQWRGVNDIEGDGMWVSCHPLLLMPWEWRWGRKEGAYMHCPTQPLVSGTLGDNDRVCCYPLPFVFSGHRRKLRETTMMNKLLSLSPCHSSPSPCISTYSFLPTPLVTSCSYFWEWLLSLFGWVVVGSDMVVVGTLLVSSGGCDMVWLGGHAWRCWGAVMWQCLGHCWQCQGPMMWRGWGALWTGLGAVTWHCWWGCWVPAESMSLPQCGPDVGINWGAQWQQWWLHIGSGGGRWWWWWEERWDSHNMWLRWHFNCSCSIWQLTGTY